MTNSVSPDDANPYLPVVSVGGAGPNVIVGGDGRDEIYTDVATPLYRIPFSSDYPFLAPVLDTGNDVDTVFAGGGTDLIFAGYGDNVDGGEGQDTLLISFLGSPNGLHIDLRPLSTGGSVTIGTGIISQVESLRWVEGTNFSDTIWAASFNREYAPIIGAGGDDIIHLGANMGSAYGGDGEDTIYLETENSYSFAHGDNGNDTIMGSNASNGLFGDEGNDVLFGFGNADRIDGGNGTDIIDGGFGRDNLNGNAGADVIYGGGVDATMPVESSDIDYIFGGDGDDIIYGDLSIASDQAPITGNRDIVYGGSGADIIYGHDGSDFLCSDNENENSIYFRLDINSDIDQIFGGNGNDSISVGFGDIADGGEGTDELSLSLLGRNASVNINTTISQAASISLYGGLYTNFEVFSRIFLTNFADIITIDNMQNYFVARGGEGNDIMNATTTSVSLIGDEGDDVLRGSTQADFLHGGTGNDTMVGRNGNDYYDVDSIGDRVIEYIGQGYDTITTSLETYILPDHVESLRFSGSIVLNFHGVGNALNNDLFGFNGDDVLSGELGNDTIDGRGGFDWADYSSSAGPISMQLYSIAQAYNSGSAGTDILINIEGLIGSAFNDVLVGNRLQNDLQGGDGDDILNGGAGSDSLIGGIGDDVFYIDNINDRVAELENEGLDEIRTSLDNYTLADHFESLRLLGNASTGHGNALDNQIFAGSSAANLYGYDGNDRIYGKNAIDTLTGGEGDNIIRGGGANDSIYGGLGDDRLYGDAGNDKIYGGAGHDFMTGGIGNDSFLFATGDFAGLTAGTTDRILDFTSGSDRIGLSGLDANTKTQGNQAFAFIGTDTFTKVAGQLRYEQVGNTTMVYGDTNGDGAADFAIALTGTLSLTAGDFIL